MRTYSAFIAVICFILPLGALRGQTSHAIAIDDNGITVDGKRVSSGSHFTISLKDLTTALGKPSRIEHGRRGIVNHIWDDIGITFAPDAKPGADAFGVGFAKGFTNAKNLYTGILTIDGTPISASTSMTFANSQLEKHAFEKRYLYPGGGSTWELKYPSFIIRAVCDKDGKFSGISVRASE
jgi:hypothetical protein